MHWFLDGNWRRNGDGPILAPMNEPPEIEDLARRFLDLWRQHLTAMTTDPANADSLQRVFAAFESGGSAPFDPAAWPGMKDFWPQENAGNNNAQNAPNADDAQNDRSNEPGAELPIAPVTAPVPTAGAAPATGVSDSGGDPVHDLERRIKELEARIAGTESAKPGPTKPGPAKLESAEKPTRKPETKS
ncbi:MAG: hypothetical protein JKY20_00195 [Alphaproteobacteria bacterium]|nr:hypothetical protein [Alphaproteobacteria bacterium]